MAEDVFGIVGTTQAGSFTVESVVAEGGFGVVYRAEHRGFRAKVALKCLKVPETMPKEQRQEFLEKFREEGELLFRLSAQIPAVVRPLQIGKLEGPRFVPFLAMEWLEGDSLDRIVKGRAALGKAPMALPKLVRLLQPVAEALARAHRFPGPDGVMTIIHRDIKPENIFIARIAGAYVAKILDFGIARARAATSQRAGRATAAEELSMFTAAYAAPEQWQPKRFGQAGPWTDVYGLAITMVEALIGRPPIPPSDELASMMGTALDVTRRPTPRTEGATVNDAVERAFAKALAVDPEDRTQTIEELWTAIERGVGMDPTILPIDPRAEGALQLHSVPPPSSRREDTGVATEAILPSLVLDAPSSKPAARPTPSQQPIRHVSMATLDDDDSGDDGDRFGIPLDVQVPSRPRPAFHAPGSVRAAFEPPKPSLKATLRAPLQIFFLALFIGVGDIVFKRVTGESLAVGPVRPVTIAAVLGLLAIVVALFRLIFRED